MAFYLCRLLTAQTLARTEKEFLLNNYGRLRSVVSRMKRKLTYDG